MWGIHLEIYQRKRHQQCKRESNLIRNPHKIKLLLIGTRQRHRTLCPSPTTDENALKLHDLGQKTFNILKVSCFCRRLMFWRKKKVPCLFTSMEKNALAWFVLCFVLNHAFWVATTVGIWPWNVLWFFEKLNSGEYSTKTPATFNVTNDMWTKMVRICAFFSPVCYR